MKIIPLDSNKEHFQQAIYQYDALLVIKERFKLELPFDSEEPFPENWEADPLASWVSI
jgi:hypothetical protein